jgi:NADPH-dependent 2,4-dienoyl-CoA reductase/sulfur reductase-like enzyme
MEAARVAALRGHHVYLADASRRLGGTPAVLALDPNRRNLHDLAAFFETQFRSLGVELMLGNRVTAEELVEFAPDAVVVATGGTPFVPDVPGIDSPNVVTALDVLRGAPTSDRVLVVGGLDNHLAAPTIAEFLADQGKRVEMISERFDFADGAEDGTRLPLAERLFDKRVTVSLLHRLECVDGAGAVVRPSFASATARRVDDATVVLACGLVPDGRLAHGLTGHIPEVHVVGDALAPRRIMHATLEGARVAHAL